MSHKIYCAFINHTTNYLFNFNSIQSFLFSTNVTFTNGKIIIKIKIKVPRVKQNCEKRNLQKRLENANERRPLRGLIVRVDLRSNRICTENICIKRMRKMPLIVKIRAKQRFVSIDLS